MQKFFVNDTELSVYTQGAGAPLLFIHGFPFDHAMYLPVCSQLKKDFQCIVPDLRGFGESHLAADSQARSITSMARFARDLNELLDALGVRENIHLCGLSMGGYIAMQFVRLFPDRVQSLILCDTRVTVDSPQGKANRVKLADSVTKTGMKQVAESMTPNLLSPKTFERRPELVVFLKEMIERQKPDGVAAAARGMAAREDTANILARLTIPVQIIVGSDDKPSPPEIMKTMAESVSKASFREITEAGHLTPLEQPEVFAEIIRQFIKG